VLIRGIELHHPRRHVLDGPGKLCKIMGITLEHNRLDLTQSDSFYLLDTPSSADYTCTPRIGISKGQEKMWRFVAAEN
jgi:DNA-3-methyladenine glycosylase